MINKIVDLLNNIIDIEILEDDGWFIQGTPSNKLIRLCKSIGFKVQTLNVDTISIQCLAERILEDESKFTNIKSGGVRKFKPNLKDLTDKLISFFKRYDYPIDIVEDRINRYINHCKDNPSMYNSALIYYILKEDISMLADDCESEVEEIDYFKQIL